MNDSAIQLSHVEKSYGDVPAVHNVDLRVERGEIFGILGPSGCGKSTLLKLIVGFLRPDRGSIVVAGRTLAGGGQWIAPEKRRIGMVVQDHALFPHLSVEKNITFGLRKLDRRQRAGRAAEILELVGLQHKASRYPHELSGGESQRVALGRALAPEPDVVLMDEPFSSLDASLRGEIRRDVDLILRDAGATAVLVTHDQEEALSMTDRLAVMREGQIVQVGTPREVYLQPTERWVAQFVGEVNVLGGVMGEQGVRTDVGTFGVRPLPACELRRRVHVAVRPEQFEMLLDPSGNAEIVDREFRGHDVLYRLRHQSGRQLLVQLPSVELRDIGDRVNVRPNTTISAQIVD